jgi:predicted chitinase
MSRAVDIVRKVAPHGKPDYVAAFEHGDGLLRQHEINTPNRLAHFLAQMMHECDALTIDWEDTNYLG